MKFNLCYFLLTLLFTACEYKALQLTPICTSPVNLVLVTKQGADCGKSNGNLQVMASGGSGNYMYSINQSSPQTDSSFYDLAAGSYVVSVKDGACSSSLSVDILNKNGINISLTSFDSGCDSTNGSITVSVSQGAAPYTFSLNQGAFSSATSFQNLSNGDYTIVAMDATGCQTSKSIKVLSGLSYVNTVSTIIQSNCAKGGCHNGTQAPDLRTLKGVQNSAATIKSLTESRTMPLVGSLTQSEIDAIACWVDDGAPDN
jgi:hypothetical protein